MQISKGKSVGNISETSGGFCLSITYQINSSHLISIALMHIKAILMPLLRKFGVGVISTLGDKCAINLLQEI